MLPKIHDFVLNKIFSIALLLKGGSGILSNKHEGNIEGSNQAFIFERVIDMTRLLNYKQSLVIIAAIILIVGSALYTPYKGTASYATLSLTRYLGYHPFFSPPTPEAVCRAINFKGGGTTEKPHFYYAEVISSRVFIQISAISLVAIGLVVLFGDKKEVGLIRKPEENDL